MGRRSRRSPAGISSRPCSSEGCCHRHHWGQVYCTSGEGGDPDHPGRLHFGIDPVDSGLVASLSRPGGNLTGVSSILLSLIPKQISILGELTPPTPS